MIWNSVWLMTVFDLAIFAIVVIGLYAALKWRRMLQPDKKITLSISVVVAALVSLGLFYGADLFAMHFLSQITSESYATEFMQLLHQEFRWPLTVFVVSGTGFGLLGALKSSMAAHARAQEELLHDRNTLKAVLDASAALVVVVDREGKVVRFNKVCESTTGYCFSDVEGKRFWEFLVEDKDVDRLVKEFFEIVDGDRIVEGESDIGVVTHETYLTTKSGNKKLIRWSDTILKDELGRVQHMIATGIDITDEQKSRDELEERQAWLDAIMGNMGDALITTDVNLVVDSFNPSAEKIFGYNADEVIGRSLAMLMRPEHYPMWQEYLKNYLNTGKGWFIGKGAGTIKGLKKDGTIITVEVVIDEFPWKGDRRFIGIVRDVSDRREMELQLQQAQKMETIGQLTGGVAHDFNNVLQAIVGSLELLQDDLPDPASESRELIDIALRAGLRGADLTRRLLAFARRQPLSPHICNINELIEETTKLVERTIREDIHVISILDKDLWRTEVDSHQLESAIMNLIANARDAMPNGGNLKIETSNITVSSDEASPHDGFEPGQYVKIAVSDTGTGMSEEVMGKIYEPFFTTKDIGKGSGLGLSMVYGFLKQSGGHVLASSEEGVGTMVKLYLRRAEPERDIAPQEVLPASVEMPDSVETVLVVEDDPEVLAFLRAMLEGTGYTIKSAEDGVQAARVAREMESVDLLITDIVLPNGKNGHQVADDLLKVHPGCKVLFISGYTEDTEVIRRSHENASVHFLSKPFGKDKLLISIHEVLTAQPYTGDVAGQTTGR